MISNCSVSIVIVNWNSGFQLKACAISIEKFGLGLVDNTIVVDNASSDRSYAQIDGMMNFRLIRSDSNLGFGKACNLGASHAGGDYLLFLNPDAALFAETLPKVLAFMQHSQNANVGICGVQLLNENSKVFRSCARLPTALGFLSHSIGLDYFIPKLGHLMLDWNHLSTRQVEHVIGAFFLVRRTIFNSLGGFDERFFVYLEDLDFSYRVQQAGWRSVYLADAQAFHAGGGTSEQVKAKRLFYSLRSRLLYAFKHFNLPGAMLVFLSTLLIEPISRTVLAIARRSWSSLLETWYGYSMLWFWLPQWIYKGVTR